MSLKKKFNYFSSKDLIGEILSIVIIGVVSLNLASLNSFLQIILLLIAGFLAFTFIEYFTHRVVFHLSLKKDPYRKWIYKIHGVHHKYPGDQKYYKTSIYLKVAVVLILNGLGFLIGQNKGLVLCTGMSSGYAFYLFVHYCIHHFPPVKPYQFFWIYHEIHHHINPRRAYGVSNPLWDIVFKTYPKNSDWQRAEKRFQSMQG